MFDPFKDFDERGYLRNLYAEKDPQIVQELEHQLFRAGLDEALAFLATRRTVAYAEFLEVHGILFSAFYPWAGQDRATTAPDSAVSKGGTWFSHPRDGGWTAHGRGQAAIAAAARRSWGCSPMGIRFWTAMGGRCS